MRDECCQALQGCWNSAWSDVAQAARISLVGISLHDFLLPAFSSLFREREKSRPFELVVANTQHEVICGPGTTWQRASQASAVPWSVIARLSELAKSLHLSFQPVANKGCRAYNTFGEFIVNEMDPVSIS